MFDETDRPPTSEPDDASRETIESAGADGPSGDQRRGPDVARAALNAARAAARGRRTAARESAPARRSGLTGSGPDAGDPQPFGALINRLVGDRGWQKNAAEARVMGSWDTLVGVDIAGHCQPRSLRAGELVVEAESTAWATQLRLLAAGILDTLARELGTGVVTKIRVHGPAAPSWRKGPRHVSGRGPRDTYG